MGKFCRLLTTINLQILNLIRHIPFSPSFLSLNLTIFVINPNSPPKKLLFKKKKMSIAIPFRCYIWVCTHTVFAKRWMKERKTHTATKKGKFETENPKDTKVHLPVCVFALESSSLPHYLWSAVQSSHYRQILRSLPLFKPCVTTLLLIPRRYAVNWNFPNQNIIRVKDNASFTQLPQRVKSSVL